MDFFAGSGTTAEALFELNAADGGERPMILVQVGEPCGAQSVGNKSAFPTISEIAKERIEQVLLLVGKQGIETVPVKRAVLQPSLAAEER